MSTSVLVFGAGGYIGEGVALAFRRYGYKVYGVIRNDAKKKFLIDNEIIPVIGDQSKIADLKEYIIKSQIIVDAIGLTSHSRSSFDQIVDIISSSKKNASSTFNYKPLFIFTSGIMTYGLDYEKEVLDETTDPKPKDEYEMVPKKAFEDFILSTATNPSYPLRSVVVRPGFVYGKHGGPIASMFFGIDPNSELVFLTELVGKRWSWVHVDDLGEAYVKISKAGGNVVNGELFNIAELHPPTYDELKIAAARLAGWKGSVDSIKSIPISAEQQRIANWKTNVVINSEKAYDLVGWKPHHVGILLEMETFYLSWKSSQQK